MIDIHNHCIPGVDDGAHDLAEAVAMCRMAFEDGIETIVATPHMMRGRWKPCTAAELRERLELLRSELGEKPRLLLGSECFFSHDLEETFADGRALPLANSRYVLIEFAADAVPPHVERPLHQVQLARRVPIIAHPERNAVFNAHPDLLTALVASGARTQITAGSLLGQFGPQAQRSAERWIQAGLVHFVASDGHNVRNRLPVMRIAAEQLSRTVGQDTAHSLTVDNPKAVVENRSLPYVPAAELPRNSGFLARLRSFLPGGR